MLKDEEVTGRTFGLLPDPNARFHIFAADGDGAQSILALVERQKSDLQGQITVVYVDTGPVAAHFALRLCKQPIDRVCIMATLLSAVSLLSTMIERAEVGVRIYATGSHRLISLITQLAEARGLDPMSVVTEQRSEGHAAAMPELITPDFEVNLTLDL